MDKKYILGVVIFVIIVFVLLKKRKETFNDENVYICITTIRKYKNALDNLLSSFPSGFTKYIVVYQNEENGDYYEQKEDGHYEVYLKRNIYEYGVWEGLYMLKNEGILNENDKFLILHDTCKLGNNTVDLANKVDMSNIDLFWASNVGQCNLCIAKGTSIDNIRELYKDVHTLNKIDAIAMEWDHTHQKSIKNVKNINHRFYEEPSEYLGKRNVYSDLNRDVLYFKSIDVEKYFVYSDAVTPHPEKL